MKKIEFKAGDTGYTYNGDRVLITSVTEPSWHGSGVPVITGLCRGEKGQWRADNGAHYNGQMPVDQIHLVMYEDEVSERRLMPPDLILAILDDQVVQQRIFDRDKGAPVWKSITDQGHEPAIRHLLKYPNRRYRIKPGNSVEWAAVYDDCSISASSSEREWPSENGAPVRMLRVELDPDTFEVVDARTEMP